MSRQNKNQKRFVTHRAASRILPPSLRSFILSAFTACFVAALRPVNNKTAGSRRNRKKNVIESATSNSTCNSHAPASMVWVTGPSILSQQHFFFLFRREPRCFVFTGPQSGNKTGGEGGQDERAERGWQDARGGAVRDKTLWFCFGATSAHEPRSRPSRG